MKFTDTTAEELEVLITGLRLVRRGAYDNTLRNTAGRLLDDALWRKRELNRKPEWEKV